MAVIKHCRLQFSSWINDMFYYIFNLSLVGKNTMESYEYIWLLTWIIYILHSFSCTFSTFYIGLLFTRTVAWVNLFSKWTHIFMLTFNIIFQLQMRFDTGSWEAYKLCHQSWNKYDKSLFSRLIVHRWGWCQQLNICCELVYDWWIQFVLGMLDMCVQLQSESGKWKS